MFLRGRGRSEVRLGWVAWEGEGEVVGCFSGVELYDVIDYREIDVSLSIIGVVFSLWKLDICNGILKLPI